MSGGAMGWWSAMRHVFGFVLGILLTPALAYGAGWGYARAGAALDPIGQTITDRTRLYGALSLMAAVGLVTGVVIVARWASPLVSLIPALAFIGWTVYFLLEPKRALQVPGDVPPAGELDAGLQVLLSAGVFALMGFALLTPAWAPRRWRRERDEPAEPEYPYV
jgi:hypothetical protein